MAPLRAHEFRLFVHFTSVRGIVEELRVAQLVPVAIFSLEGHLLDLDGAETHTHYFHVIARKPEAE
jgi:hypothetical protein